MRIQIPTIMFAAVAGTLILASCGSKKQEAPAPPEITVVEALQKDVPVYREYIGEIYGEKDIPIRARVEGFLEGLYFDEGSEVKEGQLLYSIDPRPFEEKVNAKNSEVAEAKTMLAKAGSDLNRYKPLAELNAVSKSDLDAAQAQYDASVSSLEAARANLRSAQIELGYTKIYSPINGIIGLTEARVGDFVGREPNPVILNTVSQADNVKVRFYLTETDYLFMIKEFNERKAQETEGETRPARTPGIELILADGSVYEHKGLADFINRSVDPSTGSILVQASFPNPQLILRPGMYAKLRFVALTVTDGILIPLRCVMEMQGIKSVYVVDENNKIASREITTGPPIGDYMLVTGGIEAGDKVVIDALQKVRSDMVITPKVIEFKSKTNPEF